MVAQDVNVVRQQQQCGHSPVGNGRQQTVLLLCRLITRFRPVIEPPQQGMPLRHGFGHLGIPPGLPHHVADVEEQEISERSPICVVVEPTTHGNEPIALMDSRNQRTDFPKPPLLLCLVAHMFTKMLFRQAH